MSAVTASKYQVQEVEVIDTSDPPRLTLGDLRQLVAEADKKELDDRALVYAGQAQESSSQPGRWFIGTLLAQEIER